MPRPFTARQWLTSFVRSQVLATANSSLNPYLEVALVSGRLVLNSTQANYSYGGLERAFADCFAELELARRPFATALLLGFGAGSVAALLRQSHPRCVLTGVEADPVVAELYQRYFALRPAPQLVVAEAAAYLADAARAWQRYELVVIDLFIDTQVPATCDTPAFLTALDGVLAPGGLCIWNRLLQPPAAGAATRAFEPTVRKYYPQLQVYDTLTNRFWSWRG